MDELKSTLGAEELNRKLERHRSRVSESLSDSGSVGGEKQANGALVRQLSSESDNRSGSLRKRTPEKEERQPVKGERLIEVEKAETGSVCIIFCIQL